MNDGKGKTVLLVDDDVFSSSVMAEELKLSGFDVLEGRTLNEAKEIVTSNEIDAAVIDVMFPVGGDGTLTQEDILTTRGGFRSGKNLAVWIKTHCPGMRLIAYSNTVEEDVKDWFREKGDGFLSKTISKPGDVVRYIRKILGLASGAKCFIVHGHDENSKYELKNYLQNKLKFPEPVILHEQPSLGRTIIEKFEEESRDADLVFVLLTPDDKAAPVKASNAEKRRARQNVIFEMGYFLAKFGRKRGRVILLHKGELELPSDIAGLIYIDISSGIEAAGEEIRREVADFLP